MACERLTLFMHLGGKFVNEPMLSYVGGDVLEWEMASDYLSFEMLSIMVKDAKYNEVSSFNFLLPGQDLENGAIPCNNNADCSVTFKNSKADFKFVGQHFLSSLKIVPSLKLAEMQHLVREQLKVDVGQHLCGKAKRWAMKEINGHVNEEFSLLPSYQALIRKVDPNATVDLVVHSRAPNYPKKFQRIYICLGRVKEAFKHCRRIVHLDGCLLKGPFKGELLCAVGRDANDQIYTLAWVVVEGETRSSWRWFLDHIRCDLQIGDGRNFTIMSDMQKGLELEILAMFPHVEHRFCARHLYANWKKEYKGTELQNLFWACCKSTTEADFYIKASQIGDLNGKALEDLLLKDAVHFSRAFISTHSLCECIDNNYAEAFNAVIVPARHLSIIKMLQWIGSYVMNRIGINKEKCEAWKHRFGPRIMAKLERNKEES